MQLAFDFFLRALVGAKKNFQKNSSSRDRAIAHFEQAEADTTDTVGIAGGVGVRWRRLAGIDVGNYGFEQMVIKTATAVTLGTRV